MVDQLKFKDNGKPLVSTLSREQATLPSFLVANSSPKTESRLRIFSGTANPALSQVYTPVCLCVLLSSPFH